MAKKKDDEESADLIPQMTVEDMQAAAASLAETAPFLEAKAGKLIGDAIRAIEIPRGRYDPSSRHALQVVIWMVELYAPTLLNSGGFVRAKAIAGDGIRTCRVCGCTNDKPCASGARDSSDTLLTCYWIDKDLCSECVGTPAARADKALSEMGVEMLPFLRRWFDAYKSVLGESDG